jgi:hypothetical protein
MGGQLFRSGDGATAARSCAAGGELGSGPIAPHGGAKLIEVAEGEGEGFAGGRAPAGAPEAFSAAEVRAGGLERQM